MAMTKERLTDAISKASLEGISLEEADHDAFVTLVELAHQATDEQIVSAWAEVSKAE